MISTFSKLSLAEIKSLQYVTDGLQNPIQGLKFPISFIKFPFHNFCQLFLRLPFISYTAINVGNIPIYYKDHVY